MDLLDGLPKFLVEMNVHRRPGSKSPSLSARHAGNNGGANGYFER